MRIRKIGWRAALIGTIGVALLLSAQAPAKVLFRNGGAGAVPIGEGSGSGGVAATFQNGQTFVTWTDLDTGAGGADYRYKLYESSSPITSGNYGAATLVAQGIPNNSAQIIGDCPDHVNGWPYNQTNRQTAPTSIGTSSCQGAMMQLSISDSPLDGFTGLWARTVPSNRAEYYAVVGDNGSDTYIGSFGPVSETTATPQPIQIRDSTNRVQDPDGAFGGIPGAAAGLGLEFVLHASNSSGGSVVGIDSTAGDYWAAFGTPFDSYQDGVPYVFDVFRAHSRSPQIVQGAWRDTLWWPDYGAGGTNTVEGLHQYLGVTASAETQAAYGSDSSAHQYPFQIKKLAQIFDFIRAQYGASIGLATDNWTCTGVSMGSWGCSQFVLKEYPLTYFAVSFVGEGPAWNDTAYNATCGTILFSAGSSCPNSMGTDPSLITLPDGTTPWGGTGGQTDLISQVNTATIDLTPFYWSIGKHDTSFTTWPTQLSASAAFESSMQCHGFAWNNMGHSQGNSPLNALFKENGAATGVARGHSYSYTEFGFWTDKATLCFSNSSINDDPGTGTLSNGEYDGDVVGCIDCGFNNVTLVTDTSGTLELTFGNAYMGNDATDIPTTTLNGDIDDSQTTITLTSNSGFTCDSTQQYLRIGTGSSAEVVGCISVGTSNHITISRGEFGTTAVSHSSGATFIVLPLEPTGPNAGPQSTMTVDVMPRQMQTFKPSPSSTITCEYTPHGGSTTTSHPTVDANGHWVTNGVVVNSSGDTDYKCTNP